MQPDKVWSAFSMGYTFRMLCEAVQQGNKLTVLPPAPCPNDGDTLPCNFLPSGQESEKHRLTVPKFSIAAMHEHLVKFIVADDQVSNHPFCYLCSP